MKICKFLVVLMGLLLTACGGLEVAIEQPTPTLIPPLPSNTSTVTVLATNTDVPTATVPAIPTITVASSTSVPPNATQVPPVATSSTEQEIKIFLIKLEDNGQSGVQVGCGDSAVPISVFIPRTQGVLRAALEKLLSAKQQVYGEAGYYNALYQSDLEVDDVTIEQGKAIIYLTGTVMLGGECDIPRFEAQIEQTALQFSTVTDVQVFINGQPMEDVLSLK